MNDINMVNWVQPIPNVFSYVTSMQNITHVTFADVEMNDELKDGSENEDSEERELEKAYQNVHVNVS